LAHPIRRAYLSVSRPSPGHFPGDFRALFADWSASRLKMGIRYKALIHFFIPTLAPSGTVGSLCNRSLCNKGVAIHMKYTLPIFFLLLLLTMPMAADAQSCTTAVCNAKSPGESDFLAALPSSSTTQSTVVVNIPAGSATWTGEIKYTIPSVVTSLTIQGATTVNFTGTAGTSSYAGTATDNTTIVDNASVTVTPMISIETTGTNQFFRITGLTIDMNAAGFSKFGEFAVSGNSQKFRLDHIHAVVKASTGALIRVEGSVNGVADHSVYDLGNENASILGDGIEAFNPYNDTIGLALGDGPYAQPTAWGSAKALYIESNIFNGGATNDCDQGGFYVERYNTINAVYVGFQTHGTKTAGGPIRGCRGFEAYHNYITGPGGAATGDAPSGSKIGTGIIWGNQMPQGYYRFFTPSADRNGGDGAPETNPPGGFGYCGTTVTNPSTGSANGVGSAWDGNSGTGNQSGYPCLDGIGRGQTVQALNGQSFPNRLNSVTGTVAWPHQYLEPVYLVMNNVNPASGVEVSVRDLVTLPDRDYYSECNTGFSDSTCPKTAFNGAHGTGYGLLSARPSTCTAGPGGTYGGSPTGSYGVAYFATDANGGNGEMYVCSSTNTWTGIYQPYTYPHPLVTGGSVQVGTPGDPANLTGVVK
jgi:hypothetical protein